MATGFDEGLLRRATELVPDGVVIADGSGRIVYANRSMREMVGSDGLVGTNVDALVPDARRVRHAGHRDAFASRPTVRAMGSGLELSLARSDGSLVPVEICLSRLDDDSAEVIAVVRDITDRRRSRRRLEAAVHELTLFAERERIGRDLHDVVLQRLYGLGLTVLATAAGADDATAQRLHGVAEALDDAITEVRTIMYTLGNSGQRGSFGHELGRMVAQASRVLGFTPAMVLEGPVESVLSDDVRSEMVASMREALGNVARHAAATEVRVDIAVRDAHVEVVIADNGTGPPADGAIRPGGHGLVNLQARARRLGGTCALSAGADGGAVLRWAVPY